MPAAFRPTLAALACASCLLLFTSCSAVPSWMAGSWVMDSTRSEADLRSGRGANAGANSSDGSDFSMRHAALEQQRLVEILFSGNELMTVVNGNGHIDKFRIAQATDSECAVRFKDDSVETFYRDASDIYFFVSSGGGPVKIFLLRKD